MTRIFIRALRRLLRRENGTATVEFVMAAPLVIFTFLAAFESGVYMMRYILLDRALDITIRDLRLGLIPTPALAVLKDDICDRMHMVSECTDVLKLEMFSVNTTTWAFPTAEMECIDRGQPISPVDEPALGTSNEIMLIRACLTADALFPTSKLAAGMQQDANGGYFVVAMSGFANEP